MKKNLKITAALLIAVLIVWGLLASIIGTDNAQADAVTNYWAFTAQDGTTSFITTGGQSGIYYLANPDEGYQPGQIVVQIDADASATTSTLTTYFWYSNYPGAGGCAAATSWFTATDYLPYTTDAVGTLSQVVGAEISTTVNSTASLPLTGVPSVITGGTRITGAMPYVVTSTYTYGSPTTYTVQAANAAGGGYNSVVQSLAVTGDAVAGRDFMVYGRCLKLNYAVSFGTITPTVYIQKRDYYQ